MNLHRSITNDPAENLRGRFLAYSDRWKNAVQRVENKLSRYSKSARIQAIFSEIKGVLSINIDAGDHEIVESRQQSYSTYNQISASEFGRHAMVGYGYGDLFF